MTRAASAGLAVALVGLVWAVLHYAWYSHGQIVDYPVYSRYGDLVVHRHAVPYRDFRLEYPPAALPMFVVPALLEGLGYDTVFRVLAGLCAAGVVLAALALRGRVAAVYAAVVPLALGSIVLSRFDLWPTALSALSLAALARRRTLLSALLLGTAVAAKLWPAVLVPLVVVHLWRRAGRRTAWRWLGAVAAVAAAWFLPFLALSPGGLWHVFHVEIARPLQIESLGASVLVAVHHLAGTSVGIVDSYGSQNLGGPGVHAAAVASGILAAAAVAAVYLVFARSDADEERLLLACAAAVAALVAFGKVLSPQFLIWLIPFVAVVRGVAARALFVALLVLTQLYFPKRYWEYANSLYTTESLIVLVRNLAVVTLFGFLLYRIQGSTASSSAFASSAVSARSGARTSG